MAEQGCRVWNANFVGRGGVGSPSKLGYAFLGIRLRHHSHKVCPWDLRYELLATRAMSTSPRRSVTGLSVLGFLCVFAIPAGCSQQGNTMRGSMANLTLNTGAENVVSLYASLLQLTMILTMAIGRSDHARYVAANYMLQAQVCSGASDERSKCVIV